MRFLALTYRRIESRHSGYDLRVANLCAHLPGEVHLLVAPLDPDGESPSVLGVPDVFASTEELPPMRRERARRRRHLRTSNAHYIRMTRPAGFARAQERLRQIVRESEITHVVVFGGEAAELAATLHGPTVVLDICDSASLTARRARAARPRARGLDLVREALDIHRKQRTERHYAARFDLVTTINEADTRAVSGRRPGRGDRTVSTVPNGLDEAYAGALPEPGTRRGVVFWGNHSFAPNQEALRFFVEEAHLPTLRDQGVELCVVGPEPPGWLDALAAEDPSIRVMGHVDDLAAVAGRYPIMINPMRTGSGLKNKVLEAFGMGLVVVSTPLGVEAFPQLRDGEHVVRAEDGEGLATAVLALLEDPAGRGELRRSAHALVQRHYRWSAVGLRWRELITRRTGRAQSGNAPRDLPAAPQRVTPSRSLSAPAR